MNSMLDLMEATMTRLMPLQDENVKFAGIFMTLKRGMITGKFQLGHLLPNCQTTGPVQTVMENEKSLWL